MNGFQQKQVTRALTIIPTTGPLTEWELDFLKDLKQFWWKKELKPGQNSKLNEIMRKFT